MKAILKIVLLLALFSRHNINAIELPCWQKESCYSGDKFQETDFGMFFVHRPNWHKELDNITLDMRRNRDYSILWNSSEYRVPVIHSDEADRAVEELAGEVASSVLSPLAYRIPLLVRIDHEKKKFDSRLDSAIPEIQGTVYAVSFKPRVDFSRTNPVSLEAKFSNGEEIARFVLRLRRQKSPPRFLKIFTSLADIHLRIMGGMYNSPENLLLTYLSNVAEYSRWRAIRVSAGAMNRSPRVAAPMAASLISYFLRKKRPRSRGSRATCTLQPGSGVATPPHISDREDALMPA